MVWLSLDEELGTKLDSVLVARFCPRRVSGGPIMVSIKAQGTSGPNAALRSTVGADRSDCERAAGKTPPT